MPENLISLVGIGFLILAIWNAIRVRRDLARGETYWERALFGRGKPILFQEKPIKFWCAIAVNAAIVLLFTLVAAVALRAISLRAMRL